MGKGKMVVIMSDLTGGKVEKDKWNMSLISNYEWIDIKYYDVYKWK